MMHPRLQRPDDLTGIGTQSRDLRLVGAEREQHPVCQMQSHPGWWSARKATGDERRGTQQRTGDDDPASHASPSAVAGGRERPAAARRNS